MLGNLALESRRNRCLVIGEDLCTVAHEVRVALQGGGALSYRLLYFEKDAEGDFLPPAEFPAQAAVAISTHDLPPLNAFWRGTDLERRAEFGLFPNDTVRKQQIVGRAQDRAQLLLALEREGLLPAGLRADPATVNEMSDELMIAVHAYLARSASQLMIVQPEDVFGQCEQINLPGTIDECPNWRRKLVLNLDAWRSDMRIQVLVRSLGVLRGWSVVVVVALAASALHDAGLGVPTATYRLQFQSRLHLRDGGRARALSRRPRREPLLRITVSQGASRQRARLRHHRSQRAQSRARQPGRLRAFRRGAARAPYEPHPRHGAQSHGGHGGRQSMVAGRARERTGLRLCRFLRHRLGGDARALSPQGIAAGARRSLRRGARTRRTATAFRQ